ncbi:MAG TPA: divalent metal cation transporter [Ktedonobacteraceae bacterium]|nr:divalent metal cation transporter [Ktedonobacteraceae bacterium]
MKRTPKSHPIADKTVIDKAIQFASELPKPKKPVVKRLLSIIGPGVITGFADDDESGIGTYSQTGAQYGFKLLWTVLFMLPMMYVVQEMAGRIGVVTGQGIAKNIKRYYSRFLLYPLVLLLLIANTINLGADLGAMASGTQLLVPQANFPFLVILYAAIILVLVIFVSYKRYASILKWICLSLVTYVITGFIIPLNWGQVLLAAIVPHIEWNFAFMFLVVGVLGTTISPYMIFWEPDEEVEEEIEAGMLPIDGDQPKLRKGYLGKMKLDTFIGMLCSEIITFFIIVTTAATLHVHGITNIQTPTQAASALQPLVHSFPHAGLLAKILFSIGIIGIGFLAVPIFAGSSSYAIAETFGFPEGLSQTFNQAKVFYLIIIASAVVGVLMNFLGINPFSALIYTAVLNGIIAVPLIGMILLITNNRKIMGNHTNGWLTNTIGIVTFVVMGFSAAFALYSFVHP